MSKPVMSEEFKQRIRAIPGAVGWDSKYGYILAAAQTILDHGYTEDCAVSQIAFHTGHSDVQS